MKNKKVAALFIAASLSAVGCAADVMDGGTGEETEALEEVSSTQEMIVSEKAEPPPEILGIPSWRAYIGAPKGHHARYGVSTRPEIVDERGYIVLIAPHDGRPEVRIPLFLRQSWRYGDKFFEHLTKDFKLTPLDWIGILAAIEQLDKHPVLVPPPSTYSGIATELIPEGPTVPTIPPPPPLPGDDHQGPGPSSGGGTRPTGGGTGPNHPPPPLPDYSSPPPLPPVPQGGERLARNGIFPGDLKKGWVPPGRPEDKGYKPLPGEKMEILRCEGQVVTAYKSNCVDFKPVTMGAKWASKVTNFFQKKKEDFRVYVFQNFWSGGKKPECTKTCQWVSNAGCFGELGAGLLICSGLTGGACLTAIPAIIATASAGGAAVATCIDQIRNYCDENICIN